RVAQLPDPARLLQPLLLRHAFAYSPRAVELLQHIDLRGLIGVEFQTELAETLLLQPAVYDIQRRPLLSHEQHPATECQIVGDHVRDRLRLPGARWAIEDEIAPLAGGDDSGDLRRVRRQ